MYLKELEIFGFKSFPEKTVLKFEPGITVIVGPNGCGKSNVLDSIKWALGEQSPKSLRGSKMEDIIFNGTENHPALSYVEVAMTFSNEDNYLPIDYKEVSVSRRLYRSGESEYFINKNIVRLKDVEELLMGTGIGESTYSFVEQGKIEVFLSYKPEEKRLIFDEASGIVKYKERKKETLKRLQETEENMVRLEDIISEVKRQIRYLERQVEKAKRYKKIQDELLEAEKKAASLQFRTLEEKTNNFLEELNKAKEKEEIKNNELREIKARCEESNKEIRNTRLELQEVNSTVISLLAQIENSATHIKVCQQRIVELEERDINLGQAKNNLIERLSLQEKRAEEERGRFAVIETNTRELEERIKKLQEEKERLKKDAAEAVKMVKEDKIKILEFESRKINFSNSLIEIQTNLSTLINRKKRLFLDKAKVEGFLRERSGSLKEIQSQLDEVNKKLDALREKKNGLLSREKELVSRKEDLRQRLVEQDKELMELNSSYEFLKDLHIKYETFSLKKKATIIFDEDPKDINKLVASLKDIQFYNEDGRYKAQIEVKIVSLDENQIQERIKFTQESLRQTTESLEDVNKHLLALSGEVGLEIKGIEEEEGKWRDKLQEQESLNRELLRVNEEFELVDQEITIVLGEISEYENKQKQIEEELGVCGDNLNSVNHNMAENQDIITRSEERINGIDIEAAGREAEKQALYKERDSLNSKLLFIEEEKHNITINLENIEKESGDNLSKAEVLNEEMRKLNAGIEEGKEKIQVYVQQKAELEKKESVLVRNIEEIRVQEQSLEKEYQEVMEIISNKKLEIQGLEYEKEKIKDYLRQVYHIEIDFSSQTVIEEGLESLLELKDTLKNKLESMGEVNLVAEQEFEELQKREDFLGKQKEDLVTSKEDLKKAIQKINRTSREIFLDTFNKIQEEFKKNFRFLFNGGKAELILLDPENVLESGVDIEVQPPGKKLQNVSLLSGGEKALTAISLIFAIFRVKPSPLCVLDEIDAPLDEANVDRFNHLLKEFASSSQFIIITHNKKTMSNANVLYGVTMQEKGVSKIVSVKFASQEAVLS